jgi:hypothetical protein
MKPVPRNRAVTTVVTTEKLASADECSELVKK